MDLFLDYGEEISVKSVGQLKEEFYRFHRKRAKSKTLNPITIVHNPSQYYSELEDKWFAVYYRNFFVTVTEGGGIFGPHVAQLFIQVYRGKHVWLGTAQFKFLFPSKLKLRKKLRLAIVKRKYFCSEKSATEIIEFTRPDDSSLLTIKI